MFDMTYWKEMYDKSIADSGVAPDTFGLFDRRILVPRSILTQFVEREDGIELGLKQLDLMATDGLFSWYQQPGEVGEQPGVPQYIPPRISLCALLERQGWSREELIDFSQFEDWFVEDFLAEEGCSYEEDDVAVVSADIRRQLADVQGEIEARMLGPRLPSWKRGSYNSFLGQTSTDDLAQREARLCEFLRKTENTDLEQATPKWKHIVGRSAFFLRARNETMLVAMTESDRRQLRTGFSFSMSFSGGRLLVPEVGRFEDYGVVNWKETLAMWELQNDPDRFVLRVPGFVLKAGQIILNELLSKDDYAYRIELFSLAEYKELFREIVARRRCVHCETLLNPDASVRRLYCSRACSNAARQKGYRDRRKKAEVDVAG